MKQSVPKRKMTVMKRMKSGATNQNQPLSQQIYDSTADFGVFMALLGLIGASVIGFIMFCVGIYLIFTNGTHSKKTQANVMNSKCDIYKDNKNRTHKDCNTTLQYTVNGKEYENTLQTSKLQSKGTSVEILYNPENPSDSVMKTGARRIVAYILIGVSLLIVAGAIIRYYIVKNYKVAAAATGVGEAASIVSAPFQSSSSSSFGPVESSSYDSFTPMELVETIESK